MEFSSCVPVLIFLSYFITSNHVRAGKPIFDGFQYDGNTVYCWGKRAPFRQDDWLVNALASGLGENDCKVEMQLIAQNDFVVLPSETETRVSVSAVLKTFWNLTAITELQGYFVKCEKDIDCSPYAQPSEDIWISSKLPLNTSGSLKAIRFGDNIPIKNNSQMIRTVAVFRFLYSSNVSEASTSEYTFAVFHNVTVTEANTQEIIPPPQGETLSSTSSKHLSAGAIVGIVVGCFVAIMIAIYILYFIKGRYPWMKYMGMNRSPDAVQVNPTLLSPRDSYVAHVPTNPTPSNASRKSKN